MQRVASFLEGEWRVGEGPAQPMFNPATGEVIAETRTAGFDLGAALAYGRERGGPALRAMSFAERAALLSEVRRDLKDAREELLELSRVDVGTPRGDAKFDIDGAIGTLAYYASLGKAMEGGALEVEGEGEDLTRSKRFWGHHVRSPRPGIAIHLNAFNFPAWGLCEKLAVAWLAGVPVLSKPSPITALLAQRVAELVAAAPGVPAGAFQFLAGDPHDLLDHVGVHDVIAFTGSSATAALVRAHPRVAASGARVNVEADSVNAAVLLPDVDEGSETWHRLIRDLGTELTQKAGQKCTATRRVFVPRARLAPLRAALTEVLARTPAGDPADPAVRLGPLVSEPQLARFHAGVEALLAAGAELLYRGEIPSGPGFFAPPILLAFDARAHDGGDSNLVHEREVFGPVLTLLPYDEIAEVPGAVARGQGALVNSLYGDERETLTSLARALLPWSGRLFIASAKVADSAPPPGVVLPACVHGGPGRAGGGEELGGLRALELYWQRSALQGDRAILDRLVGLR